MYQPASVVGRRDVAWKQTVWNGDSRSKSKQAYESAWQQQHQAGIARRLVLTMNFAVARAQGNNGKWHSVTLMHGQWT